MDKDSKLITEAWYRSLSRNAPQQKVQVIARARHRNGVSGAPFDVYLFKDEDGATKVAMDFGGENIGVLNLEDLAQGNIAMNKASYRGFDTYAKPLRAQNPDYMEQQASMDAPAPPEEGEGPLTYRKR